MDNRNTYTKLTDDTGMISIALAAILVTATLVASILIKDLENNAGVPNTPLVVEPGFDGCDPFTGGQIVNCPRSREQ